jgi:hypothetical protein
MSPLHYWNWIVVGLLLLASTDAVKEIFVCDNDIATRSPTILESVSGIFHTGGNDLKSSFDDITFKFYDRLPIWTKVPIPVSNWLSDGVYSISIDDSEVKSKVLEVNLLQRDSQWSLISAPFCMLEWQSWCSCAMTHVSELAKLHFEDQSPCVTKLSKGKYEYYVDPSRPSCVQLLLMDDALLSKAGNLTSFRVVVPTADTFIVRELFSRSLKEFPELLRVILLFFNHIPLYLVSLLIGLCFTFYAPEIAEDKTFQVALQIFLGLFTALIVLLFAAHRILNGIFTRHASSVYMPRIFDSIFGFSLVSVAYQYRNFLMGQACEILLRFWDEGAFGFWWLGRVYFASCIVASISICHFFNLFRDPDSRSFFVSLLSCRFLGWLFLLNSSSSIAVSCVITGLIAFSSPLRSYFHYSYFAWAGYLQPVVGNVSNASGTFLSPSQRKLSKNETEALVKSTTAREMEKLRKFLKENPHELAKFDQTMREDDKEATANLVGQFAANLYSGRPRPPSSPCVPTWTQRIIRMIRDAGVVVLLGSIVFLFTMNSDTVSNIFSTLLNSKVE